MKPGIAIGAGLIDPYKLGCATVVACVFVPLLVLSAVRTNQPHPTVNLQVWISNNKADGADEGVLVVDDGGISNTSTSGATAATATVQPGRIPTPGKTSDATPVRVEDERQTGATARLPVLIPEINLPLPQNSTAGELPPEAADVESTPDESRSTVLVLPTTDELRTSNTSASPTQALPLSDGKSPEKHSATDGAERESAPEQQVDPTARTITDPLQDGGVEEEKSKVECDFSQVRTDFCELHGDVRVHGPSSSIKLITKPQHATQSIMNQDPPTTSWKIRPYARKWEGASTLSLVKELTLSMSSPSDEGNDNSHYKCGKLHRNLPAVVFSTGGFQGNFFHDLADVMIPLFLTSHKYSGEVQFLIVDFKPQWVKRYKPLLTRLSRYEVINLDTDDRVHCFKDVTVGLQSNQELGVNPEKAPEGLSMPDFRRFLRTSFQLKREFVLAPPKQLDDSNSSRKPTRMVIVSRKKTRILTNERQVARMARRMGFKVVIAGLQQMKNLTQMARIVNSCDVLLGMHGAGLTNMVFLPTNATMIQIIPWGDMKYPCRFSYGDPAVAMGLRYIEYEIDKKESSLIKRYPQNHPVFTDPLSIHKQGFVAIWSTFLSQDVTVDLGRFKGILQQALQPR